ncbi:MAG: hypothetical protein JO353_13755 [Phycisphaerae bacterium]|nr:hypothetical protein [Phycisphaerae bacterium]
MPSKPWATSDERTRLLERIRRRFDITMDQHDIGPFHLPFTRVRDPDVVLDEVVAAEDRRKKLTGLRHASDELHLPYWAELWDSAVGVGEYIASVKRPAGRTALDLGCGMGFTGMVAAAAGFEVLAADLEPDALLFARLNIGCPARRLNWRTDSTGHRFDLIIGADVLYDKTEWEFLERFWRNNLAEGGTVILGEPGRQTGDLFLEWIASKDWSVRKEEQRVKTRAVPIRLFVLTRAPV